MVVDRYVDDYSCPVTVSFEAGSGFGVLGKDFNRFSRLHEAWTVVNI